MGTRRPEVADTRDDDAAESIGACQLRVLEQPRTDRNLIVDLNAGWRL